MKVKREDKIIECTPNAFNQRYKAMGFVVYEDEAVEKQENIAIEEEKPVSRAKLGNRLKQNAADD